MMTLEALLRAARDGQPSVWPQLGPVLYAELEGFFRRRCPGEDANELAQATVIIVWEKLPRLEPTHSISGWVFGIARNMVRRVKEERARRPLDSVDGEHLAPLDPATGPNTALRRAELFRLVGEEMPHLPEDFRVAVEHYLADGGAAELARQLGIPATTARSRRRRGLVRLRVRVSARYGTPIPPNVSKLTSISTS